MDLAGLDIREAVSDREIAAVCDLARSVARPGMVMAEVGCWKGFSTIHLAEVAKGTNGVVYAIDHWKGNTGTGGEQSAKDNDIFTIFWHNVQHFSLEQHVIPMRMDSREAAARLRPLYPQLPFFDLVFLDGDHRYTPFCQDLKDYYALVRPGGILCGHDCEDYYSTLPSGVQREIDRHREVDYTGYLHAGVIAGLHDVFHDKHERVCENIWCVRKAKSG